ncbi:hypothetical protein NLU13_4806 [Sarocladium strictum]|uniref:Uncharacterized protein n=1 Tax=Sarocladium strictum TaxID=5046 RepID=A0AA39L915_SARSR|nr:hypothetical protein NLU13_4806 [Sarocladium strictum]
MAQSGNMDDFVNWDQAGASIESSQEEDQQTMPGSHHSSTSPEAPFDDNIDLVLANVNEDDFSFHALQHFTNDFSAPLEHIDPSLQDFNALGPLDDFPALQWETPDVPCAQCALGGYSCKKIREGAYQGFCTSCVALMIDCSFGGVVPPSLNPTTVTLPPVENSISWASSGNATPIIEDGEHHVADPLQPLSSASALELFNIANASNASAGTEPSTAFATSTAPKVGARLSRESVRVLKNWLSTHNRHPYPSDEEKEVLQRNTGLSKTQITNWLANARRRGKVQPHRSTSPQVGNWSSGVEIPARRGTPALESMNPLQRWQHSPPEHEPASVTAIARAVTTSSSAISSGLNSPFSSFPYTDDGSGKSICNQSSASSIGTSQSSNGSRGSAYSHGSRNSFGSFGSGPFSNHSRRRRRRRAAPRQSPDGLKSLSNPLKTFQCTFCTETYRTKHDWQRHEKSLHLSLERWVCAPEGARIQRPETGQICCAFCSEPDPDDAHIESHNHSSCQERTLEERTFYRKDHLNQHLRLVHNVKFADWSMKSWKVAAPEIRSRCGFCGIVLDTWTTRVDHLAEHFKTGKTMADWEGDWGFEAPVLAMVENSVPPYLIHHERLSPLPYIAGRVTESPRNAYELIKLELAYYAANYQQHNPDCKGPTDEEMMVEACRIIFASETLSLQGIATQVSWLRDIIMSDEELALKARFGPLRSATENRLASLKINGKDNLFEECPMEQQLHEFVKAKRLLGLTAMDNELQEEACKIVGRVEEVSTNPSERVANWLVRLATSSTKWLAPFRQRASLPRSDDIKHAIIRSTDPRLIDSTIHSYSRLERELADFLQMQRAMGVEPTDEDLQRQARIIIYEFDDGWNQTAADSAYWLDSFKSRHPPVEASPAASGVSSSFSHLRQTGSTAASAVPSVTGTQAPTTMNAKGDPAFYQIMGERLILNQSNCYRGLELELARFVRSMMSPNNPNQHIPTDAELQHQARWIIHNDDDPWNWTAADSPEWLANFKRQVGLVPGGPDSTLGAATTFNWSCPNQPKGNDGVISHNTLTQPIAPVPRTAAEMAADAMMLEGMPDMNGDPAALQEMDFGFMTDLGLGNGQQGS